MAEDFLEMVKMYGRGNVKHAVSVLDVHPYWEQFEPPSALVLCTIFVLLLLLSVVAFIGNAITIVVYTQDRHLNSRIRPYILNLALTDLAPSLTTNWMVIISCAEGRWSFGPQACKAHAFILSHTGFVSLLTISCIALKRLSIVTSSTDLRRPHIHRKHYVLCEILSIWLYAFALSLPPLFGWGYYGPEGYLISCGFDMISRSTSNISYHIYCYTFGFFVPVFALLYCYSQILFAFRRFADPRFRPEASCLDASTDYQTSISVNEQLRRESRQRQSRRAERMIVLVTLTYLAAWTPYAVVALIGMFGPVDTIGPLAVTVCAICAKSATAYNPIVYCIMDTQFRARVRKLFQPVLSNPLGSFIRSLNTASRQQNAAFAKDRRSSYSAMRNHTMQQEARSLTALAQGNLSVDEICNMTGAQIRQMARARLSTQSSKRSREPGARGRMEARDSVEIEQIFASSRAVIFAEDCDVEEQVYT